MAIIPRRAFPFQEAWGQAVVLGRLLFSRCDHILVVGSLRRKKPVIHDIDIVAIPTVAPFTQTELQQLLGSRWTWGKGGQKIVSGTWEGIPVDIYFAIEETWWTLVLIRTGSEQHNVKLASMAKHKGWSLHAGGGGLTDEKGQRIAGNSEYSFFNALGIPYVEPENR